MIGQLRARIDEAFIVVFGEASLTR
jgi:hypothetical protein